MLDSLVIQFQCYRTDQDTLIDVMNMYLRRVDTTSEQKHGASLPIGQPLVGPFITGYCRGPWSVTIYAEGRSEGRRNSAGFPGNSKVVPVRSRVREAGALPQWSLSSHL